MDSPRPVWDESDFARFQEHAARQAQARKNGRDRGDLEITNERVLLSLPRGDREELRLTLTTARTGRGKEVGWYAVGVHFKDQQGKWRAGRSVTIRGRELGEVTVALLRACSSRIPDQLHAAARAIVEALKQ